jgi:hypothetical protein
MDADDPATALLYFKNRAKQLLYHGLQPAGEPIDLGWGLCASLVPVPEITSSGSELYVSKRLATVYVFKSHRGKNLYVPYVTEQGLTIVCLDDCDMERFLAAKGVPHVALSMPDWPELRVVERLYSDKVTRRTGIHLINHVLEGMAVMRARGCPEVAIRAFCLHPVVQGDEDLREAWAGRVTGMLAEGVTAEVLILAMEYRSVANEYLSGTPQREIRLSPLAEVNEMLVADKIQNRKDFERSTHSQTHPKRDRLSQYFREWLAALQITEDEYERFKSILSVAD